jgi:DNA primase
VKTFPKELLAKLLPDDSYWIGRGISPKTLRLFEGGVVKTGKMANRYAFPIFDHQRNIIGFSGRDLTGKALAKWKHIGQKTEWKYPLFVNYQEIDSAKEVALVESIGDGLSLYEGGYHTFVVTFGVELSIAVMNTLLRVDPKRIIIALNNEPDNNNIGNIAAQKMKSKLLRHFDPKQVVIALPPQKDFNDMLQQDKQSIKKWYDSIS